MNLEEPINIYRQVSESHKGKNKGFLFLLSWVILCYISSYAEAAATPCIQGKATEPG
jgi:hypothetical protein